MTVFYFLVLVSLIIISKKITNKIKLTDAMLVESEHAMNLFIQQSNIHLSDIVSFDFSNKIQSGLLNKTTVIGKELDLGYDFIISNLPSEYKTTLHLHKKANEMCYLISGKIEAIVHKSNRQEKSTLKTGEWVYIRKSEPHTIEALEDSVLIVIAKPPVFKRVSDRLKNRSKAILNLK